MSTLEKSQTRRQKVEAREADILKSAHDIFQEKGFEKTTMAQIARRSGVSEGTLYLYFANKTALMQAVLTNFYVALTESAQDGIIGYADTRDRLRFLAHLHLERSLGEWRMLMLASTLYRDGEGYEESAQYRLNKAYVKTFDSVIREARNRGEIAADKRVSLVRDIFYGSLEHLGRTLMLRGQAADYKTSVDAMLPMLFSAIGLGGEAGNSAHDNLKGQITRLEHILADMKRLEGSGRETG